MFAHMFSRLLQVKGLFNESIPPFLHTQAVYAGSSNVISYLHVVSKQHSLVLKLRWQCMHV